MSQNVHKRIQEWKNMLILISSNNRGANAKWSPESELIIVTKDRQKKGLKLSIRQITDKWSMRTHKYYPYCCSYLDLTAHNNTAHGFRPELRAH